MIAIDLSRQQQNGDEPKANQQINFTENLDPDGNSIKFFITEEARGNFWKFSEETEKVLEIYFTLM